LGAYQTNIDKFPLVSLNYPPHLKLVPLLFGVFKSENSEDLGRCLKSVKNIYHTISGGEDLNVETPVCDQSDPIALAVRTVFENSKHPASCYFHVQQGCKKN
jgi:hypothetical protein